MFGKIVEFLEFWKFVLFQRVVQCTFYIDEGVSLLDMKFLDGVRECRFEVGGDGGLNIFNFFFKIFAKSFHCFEMDGVNYGGYSGYHIRVCRDWC